MKYEGGLLHVKHRYNNQSPGNLLITTPAEMPTGRTWKAL